jgi:putative methyltransferase (TIGR04325 family)
MRQLAYPILRLGRRLGYLFFRLSDQGYSDVQLATSYVDAELLHLTQPQIDDGNFCAAKGLLPLGKVLDFGGGGGRHSKTFFNSERPLDWAVVETSAFCNVARAKLLEKSLSFFDSVESAVAHLGRPDLVHVSSSIQYTTSPLSVFQSLLDAEAEHVVLEKLVVTSDSKTRTFWQYSNLRANIPAHPGRKLGRAGLRYLRYRLTAAPKSEFLRLAKEAGYSVKTEWTDPPQSHLPLGRGLRQIGMILSTQTVSLEKGQA